MTHEELPFSPAAERNKGPILDVLRRVLPSTATVLEIASGTGQHAAHFAANQPGWEWQPTDGDGSAIAGIARRCAGLSNVRPPLHLDVLSLAWPRSLGRFDALYCANMLHIAPWATCSALMRGAARHLNTDGLVVLYGPFIVDGEVTVPSNMAFDADLRARDPDWGLRRLAYVVEEAKAEGMTLEQRLDMPANNLTVVFRRG